MASKIKNKKRLLKCNSMHWMYCTFIYILWLIMTINCCRFITKSGRTICSDTYSPWAKRTMKMLDLRRDTLTVQTTTQSDYEPTRMISLAAEELTPAKATTPPTTSGDAKSCCGSDARNSDPNIPSPCVCVRAPAVWTLELWNHDTRSDLQVCITIRII